MYLTLSFLGPESFKRREPMGENGEPVSGNFIPAGARFDPYYPGILLVYFIY